MRLVENDSALILLNLTYYLFYGLYTFNEWLRHIVYIAGVGESVC